MWTNMKGAFEQRDSLYSMALWRKKKTLGIRYNYLIRHRRIAISLCGAVDLRYAKVWSSEQYAVRSKYCATICFGNFCLIDSWEWRWRCYNCTRGSQWLKAVPTSTGVLRVLIDPDSSTGSKFCFLGVHFALSQKADHSSCVSCPPQPVGPILFCMGYRRKWPAIKEHIQRTPWRVILGGRTDTEVSFAFAIASYPSFPVWVLVLAAEPRKALCITLKSASEPVRSSRGKSGVLLLDDSLCSHIYILLLLLKCFWPARLICVQYSAHKVFFFPLSCLFL